METLAEFYEFLGPGQSQAIRLVVMGMWIPFRKAARAYVLQAAILYERHWDDVTAYCRSENKVPLGFVEELNNKIRVIQRRCHGLRNEDYLHLKILTRTLPPLPPH